MKKSASKRESQYNEIIDTLPEEHDFPSEEAAINRYLPLNHLIQIMKGNLLILLIASITLCKSYGQSISFGVGAGLRIAPIYLEPFGMGANGAIIDDHRHLSGALEESNFHFRIHLTFLLGCYDCKVC